MQFHTQGFQPGSPFTHRPRQTTGATGTLPETCDVLIVGTGPAGLTLAAQLSAFDDIDTLVIEKRDGPMVMGQADGIACRTVEMFNAFGFAELMMKEAYWVNETSFWKPDPANPSAIKRFNRIQDTEDGLSEFPHLILNQARVQDYYLELMYSRKRPLQPYYNWGFVSLTSDETQDYPVTVTLENGQGEQRQVRAKYVVGCDGARSKVRKAIGLKLEGDAANKAWGVMDVLAKTDFPDIRLKAAIQSADQGNVLIIPREGGSLVRLYVELDKLASDERARDKDLDSSDLIAAAQRILAPFSFDVKEVVWWSIYEIGQRLTQTFDNSAHDPRVFIAGDACHTHSPKAGQGMNVSMQDAFNLGWKLASVLQGQAKPDLLQTYSQERQAVAQKLIDFDKEWSSLFSSKDAAADPEMMQRYFVQHGRYTAGVETLYQPGLLTSGREHQSLAKGFVIGKRFHSAPVVRLADAKPMELGHCVTADGRWRLFAFASKDPRSLDTLMDWLEKDAGSPLNLAHVEGKDRDAFLDVRGIYQQSHRDLDFSALPALLRPCKGLYELTDYEKAFCPDLKQGPDIFDLRGLDRDQGCMVLVRPDQYVAQVLPLDQAADLSSFFCKFLMPSAQGSSQKPE